MQTNPIISYEIHVVLVKTLYALNIGSVSRAMSNMGAIQLHLIQPQCALTYAAQQMAANGQEALNHRREYASWNEFLEQNPEGVRIAFTARDGRARKLLDLQEGLGKISGLPNIQRSKLNKIYLIFGPEDCGLSGFDVDQAHYACSIPTYGPNWSLNLAQAVLLALFIVRDQWGGARTPLNGQKSPQRPNPTKDLFIPSLDSLPTKEFFLNETTPSKINPLFQENEKKLSSTTKVKSKNSPDKTLYEWIEVLGFDLKKRRINAFTVMRRILLHNVPTPKELRIFEAVLQQTIRKLKEHRQNKK